MLLSISPADPLAGAIPPVGFVQGAIIQAPTTKVVPLLNNFTEGGGPVAGLRYQVVRTPIRRFLRRLPLRPPTASC